MCTLCSMRNEKHLQCFEGPFIICNNVVAPSSVITEKVGVTHRCNIGSCNVPSLFPTVQSVNLNINIGSYFVTYSNTRSIITFLLINLLLTHLVNWLTLIVSGLTHYVTEVSLFHSSVRGSRGISGLCNRRVR